MLLTILATLCYADVLKITGDDVLPKKSPVVYSYAVACKKVKEQEKAVVLFIGCDVKDVPGVILSKEAKLDGVSSPCILVGRWEEGGFNKCGELKSSASVEEILKATKSPLIRQKKLFSPACPTCPLQSCPNGQCPLVR